MNRHTSSHDTVPLPLSPTARALNIGSVQETARRPRLSVRGGGRRVGVARAGGVARYGLSDDLDEGHRVLVQVAASGYDGGQRVEDDHQDGHHQGHHPQDEAEDAEGQ